MSNDEDFEHKWLKKFSDGLREIAGEETCHEVMKGSEGLSTQSSRKAVIAWSQGAMAKLDTLIDEEKRKEILTRCACQYPKSDLLPIRMTYEKTKDIDLAHQMLRKQFESFLRDTLNLKNEYVDEILSLGWGLAGIKRGMQIIATKIPKSGYLNQYMEETDPEIRRQYYCHCPRVRDVLRSSETISPIYCYCGAGFYKSIWEEILQGPVEVKVLETVLSGGEVCRFEIQLPLEL